MLAWHEHPAGMVRARPLELDQRCSQVVDKVRRVLTWLDVRKEWCATSWALDEGWR
jgi:hypothetical protein